MNPISQSQPMSSRSKPMLDPVPQRPHRDQGSRDQEAVDVDNPGDCSQSLQLALDRTTGEDEDMQRNVSEFPKYPFPHVPQPNEPLRPQVQQPTILVYERQGWEYQVVTRNLDQLLSPGELNTLGKDGWELVGVVSLPNTVQFYLKRIRA